MKRLQKETTETKRQVKPQIRKGKTIDDLKSRSACRLLQVLIFRLAGHWEPTALSRNRNCILELICEKLEIELKIEQVDFETIIPGVRAGKFDAGVSGITVDEKRQKMLCLPILYCLPSTGDCCNLKAAILKERAILKARKYLFRQLRPLKASALKTDMM